MKIWKGALTGILAASLIISCLSIYLTYGSGSLVIEMMDPPEYLDLVSYVYINYSAIMIHRAGAKNESGWYTVAQEGEINLTAVVNVPIVISQAPVQAGKYNIIRFNITEAIVTVNDEDYPAIVVNGRLNIPIIRGGVQVKAGEKTYLLIDITPKITGSEAHGFRLVPAAKAIPG